MTAREVDSAWEEFRASWYGDPSNLGLNARQAFEAGWNAGKRDLIPKSRVNVAAAQLLVKLARSDGREPDAWITELAEA